VSGRVLVLGNAGVDLVMRVPRLPRPGETLVAGPIRRAPGGKGLNQAVVAARAGAAVLFCASLGRDADGDWVAERLGQEPLALRHFPRPGPPTDTSIVLVSPDGENCIVTAGDCADALEPAEAERFAARAGAGDILLLQGNLGLAATLAGARAAQAGGARVILNTAPLRWPVAAVLACCWGVVANAGEAEAITGLQAAAAAAALAAMGPALAIVTMGAAGCIAAGCIAAAGIRYPAPPVRVVDSTGAGDAFCGALAAALAGRATREEAIAAAQRTAADTVTRPGAFDSLPPAMKGG